MLSRRRFTLLAGSVIGGQGLSLLLEACGQPASPPSARPSLKSTAPADMQLMCWGNSDRASRTNAVISLFEQRMQQYRITGQYSTWPDHWDKLAARMADGSPPDLIQMDMRYLAKYISSGSLLDLSKYAPDHIRLRDVDKGLLEQARVAGFYGLPIAGNMQAVVYNATVFDKAGLSLPGRGYTWSDFAAFCVQLSKVLPAGIWPIEDHAGDTTQFEVFVRQHGHELYTSSGGIAFTKEEVLEWLGFWNDLRQAGAVAPFGVSHKVTGEFEPTSGLATRKVAMAMAYSNFLEQYSNYTKDRLQIMSTPSGVKGSRPGVYVKVSMMLSIATKSRFPSQAAQFMDLWINDAQAAKALGLDRGTPASAKVGEAIRASLTPPQQAELDFFELERSNVTPKKILDPAGAGSLQSLLFGVADSIALGTATLAAGAEKLMVEATRAIPG